MVGFRFGVFAQLISGFILAIVFTIVAAGVGIFSIQKFHNGIEEVALTRLPAMTLAYQLGQQSEAIVASAPVLVRAATQAQRETVSFRIADRVRWLQEIIDSLQAYETEANVLKVIVRTREELVQNFDYLDTQVKKRINISELKQRQVFNLRQLVIRKAEIDAQEKALWFEEFNDLLLRLLVFSNLTDTSRFAAQHQALLVDLAALHETEQKLSDPAAKKLLSDFHDVALGENGIIFLQKRYAEVILQISESLALNERLSSRFVYSINDLIRRMRQEVEDSSRDFQQLVESRTSLLAYIVLTAIVLLSLISGVFFWRVVLRLRSLKRSMRIHAEGGDAMINITGADEISDMADALRYLVREIKRREEDMRVSEARFRDVAEATSDWVWETDEELSFSLISDRFFEMTGFKREDVLGASQSDFIRITKSESEDPEKWMHHSNDLRNRRRFRDFSFSIKCPDGLWRQVKISGKPIFNSEGEFMGYRGTGSDITAETQARSRLMAANEIMPGAFALWDHENRLVLCNRKYYQFYKVLNDRIRPGVTFEELVKLMEQRNAIVDGDGYGERRKKFRMRPTGIFVEALSDGRYLQVSEARTLDGGMVSLVIDITDRIVAETRLEQARQEAENANKAKSKFLAAASHDLRQPLHAIGMFLSALEERRRKVNDENAQDDLRIIANISDSLGALRSLLNSLLDISKLDAGVMKADKTALSLCPLIERLVKQYQGRAEEKGLVLKSFCPDVIVNSDPVLLERVLSNLLSNAVRYTQDGGVLIGVRRRGEDVVVQVSDRGVGIPADKLSDIFVEFHQLDNPARDRRRGLGLGLAIVERVIALLGHRLDVKSEVGRGTSFFVTLPRDELVVQPVIDKPIEVALSGGTVPLILVIDDEPEILEGMEQLILGWKYRVITASSSKEALRKLDESEDEPNLILADYRLQENVTGAEAIRLIQDKLGRSIPAAIITGDTAPDRIQEAKASGFVLLHKPLRPAKLRQLIRSLQSQYSARM